MEKESFPLFWATRALIVQRDPSPLGEHSQRFCFGERISSQNGRLRALWQEGRELYAQCNVEAGVAECNKKLSQ
jgi:hypothetical protein